MLNLKDIFKQKNEISILDTHPDAIIITNSQDEIILWNKRSQEIFGYTAKEALGQNSSFVISGGIESVRKNLVGNKQVVIKTKTKAGQQIFVEVTASESLNSATIISIRNISEKYKLIENILDDYEQTKKINESRNSFIVDISHDLKTPAQSIIGFSQALTDGLGGELNEKQQKYLHIISRNANNLLALLSSIIDISKLESGKMDFNLKSFDIAQLVKIVEEIVRPTAEIKRLDFEIDLTDLMKKACYSDESMIKQILLNILNNAVKFTDSGSIMVKVSHPDLDFVRYHGLIPAFEATDKSYLLFSVTDTGIGIQETELNKIFDEYRHVDRTNRKYSGSGLGLAITKKLIEELFGVIWVESEVMQGATFNFIIPVEKHKTPEF